MIQEAQKKKVFAMLTPIRKMVMNPVSVIVNVMLKVVVVIIVKLASGISTISIEMAVNVSIL